MLKLRNLLLLACWGMCLSPVFASEALNQRAVGILHKYCTSCHGSETQEGGLRLDSAEGFRAGGDSGESLDGDGLLWRRVGVDADMPPEKSPQPSNEEKAILQQWLANGAVFPADARENRPAELADAANRVFRKHCFSCHGQQFKAPGLNFGSYETLVHPVEGRVMSFLTGGDPANSLIWKRIANGTMPPKSQQVQMTAQEKDTINAWIAAGAPRWPKAKAVRTRVTELDVQQAILAHLNSLPESARRHQRYFTFAHLHNNPLLSDEELAMFKAALSKAINSLTWESEIVVPQPVDSNQTVYVVDLRDLDWTDQNHWNKLFDSTPRTNDEQHEGYPYGLEFQESQLERLAEDIFRLAETKLHKLRVRADWFVVKATRPPLYHELLELPDTATALERRLEVDTIQDWKQPDLMRGAVIRSKVSTHNRLLDRHRALHGAYWISYDFKTSRGTVSLPEKPLGPNFEGHPFPQLAFVQDGGEAVFTLPNGLNGYYLLDGQKKRIARGPIEIVRDSNETSGTPEIVTGLSCLVCHKHGVVRFEDVIRRTTRLQGDERRKLEDLFTPVDKMNERLTKDEEKFLTALLKAVQPFVPVSSIDELRNLPDEPISVVVRYYHSDLTLDMVAAELDFQRPEQVQLLRASIAANTRIAQVLGPLLQDEGVIKREVWESRNGGNSGFQTVAVELNIGVPID